MSLVKKNIKKESKKKQSKKKQSKKEKKVKKEPKTPLKPPLKKDGCINLDSINSPNLCLKLDKPPPAKVISATEQKKIVKESSDYILSTCDTNSEKYTVFFTSGEAESNMIILYTAVNAYKKIRKVKPHVIISSVEHDSVITIAKSLLDSDQIELSIIKPNVYGCVLSESITSLLKPNTCLVSITYINHELGSVNNISKIGDILHEKRIPLHSDCSYIFGKHKIDLAKTNIDAATVSFDKLNGPQGIGALIIRNDLFNGYKLNEHSTLLENKPPHNTPNILNAVASLKLSMTDRKNKNAKMLALRNTIIDKLSADCQTMTFANFVKSDSPPLEETEKSKNKLVILGPPVNNESYYTPSILSFMLSSPKQKTAAMIKDELEKKEIFIGVPDLDKTQIYNEIGMPKEAQPYIIRVSLSDDITSDDINTFISEIHKIC